VIVTEDRPRPTRAARLYRRLLRLYPAEFRRAYARELSLVFDDCWRDADSVRQRLGLGLRAMTGVLTEAPKEQKEELDVLRHDIRHAFRYMRKEAATTIAIVALLALGMGSATLIFSFANGLFLRPLPYPDADRLVAVDEYSPTDPHEFGDMSAPNYADVRAGTHLLVDVGLYTSANVTLRGDGPAERVRAGQVTDGVFRVLGVAPVLGHTFTRLEDVAGAPRVAIIGADLWRSRYGSDPNILGRTLDTGNHVYQIVGVMPAGFTFPDRSAVWFPRRLDLAQEARTDYNSEVIGRLAPGATVKTATDEVGALLTAIHRAHPDADNGWRVRVRPLRDVLTTDYRAVVTMLLIAVGLLLFIACTNVSNLLLAKASGRVREMAVRRALGATRSRLVRQLVVESLVLAIAGGSLGVLFAYVGVPALLGLVPIDLPAWMNFSVDGRVLIFAGAVSLMTSLVFGVAPSLSASSGDLTPVLRDGDRAGSHGVGHRLWHNGLVIAEVALSVLLLVGAGLMLRSFVAIRTQVLGYEPARVLSLVVDYPDKRYPSGAPARALLREVSSRLSSLPGVTSVAFGTGIPLQDGWSRIFTIEGRPVPLEKMPFVNHVVVSPGYFRTLGIPFIRGRDFTDADYQTPHVMVVAQAFATTYWPGENPIGKRVRFGPPSANGAWEQIVGVVGDTRHANIIGEENPTVYLPYGAYGGDVVPNAVIIKTTDPATLPRDARERITAFDSTLAVTAVRSLGEVIDRATWRDRFVAWLVGGFALMALGLAAAGLYGVLAYTVSLQTREIGIRMALGASAGTMRRLLMRRGLLLTGIGLGIGLAVAFALARLLAAFLYRISPTDAFTFTVVPAIILTLGLVASAWPARQATRVDPLVALRHD
jgi:putative ABC transport system permease protein